MDKDAKEDSFTTAASSKGTHGSDAPTHFDEETFDDIGGAQSFPMNLRAIKEGQELFQIAFQTSYGFRRWTLPASFPPPEEADCIRHTHYAKKSADDSQVVHVFLKPDTDAEIKTWASKLGEDSLFAEQFGDPLPPTAPDQTDVNFRASFRTKYLGRWAMASDMGRTRARQDPSASNGC